MEESREEHGGCSMEEPESRESESSRGPGADKGVVREQGRGRDEARKLARARRREPPPALAHDPDPLPLRVHGGGHEVELP